MSSTSFSFPVLASRRRLSSPRKVSLRILLPVIGKSPKDDLDSAEARCDIGHFVAFLKCSHSQLCVVQIVVQPQPVSSAFFHPRFEIKTAAHPTHPAHCAVRRGIRLQGTLKKENLPSKIPKKTRHLTIAAPRLQSFLIDSHESHPDIAARLDDRFDDSLGELEGFVVRVGLFKMQADRFSNSIR